MAQGASLSRYIPYAIALLALVLRLWGIDWGLPDGAHAFSYHPDETDVVAAALPNAERSFLDTGFYNYGEWASLLDRFVIQLALGLKLVSAGAIPSVPSAGTLLIARLVTAVLGAGTCFWLCGIGRKLSAAATGRLAAALYAVAPLPVQHGHFATVDVPAVFWLCGALYFAIGHVNKPRLKKLALTGLFVGLAAATKYSAGVVVLAGIAAWFFGPPRQARGLVALLGASLLGFLLGCPGALINFPTFVAGLSFEMEHARGLQALEYVQTPIGLIYHLFHNLPWGMGGALTVLSVLGVVLALRAHKPETLVVLAFALPYYLLIGLAVNKYARYTLPLYPCFFLLIELLLPRDGTSRWRKPVAGVLGLSGALALVMALGFDSVMSGPDPRDQAAAFIKQSGVASVGFARGPWFWSPPLLPTLATPRPNLAKQFALEWDGVPKLYPTPPERDFDPALLEETQPDAIALSELEYADALRLRDPNTLSYLAQAQTRLPNEMVFGRPVTFLGIPITTLDRSRGLPMQRLPHDMLYTNPTVVIKTR